MYEAITIDQAAEMLAQRRFASAQVGGLVKAADWKDTTFGTDMGTGTLRNTLIGGGLGAGIGALSGYANADEDDGMGGALRGAVRGGVSGGALGGGATLGYHALKNLITPDPTGANKSDPTDRTEITLDPTSAPGRAIVGGGVGTGAGYAAKRHLEQKALRVAEAERLAQAGAAEKVLAHRAQMGSKMIGPATEAERAAIAAGEKLAPKGLGWFARKLPWLGGAAGALTGLAIDPDVE